MKTPWAVAFLPDGQFLVTERDRARLSLVAQGRRRTVAFPSRSVWTSGETGLMSLAVDPRFGRNHRFWTCHGGFLADGGGSTGYGSSNPYGGGVSTAHARAHATAINVVM